MEGAPETDPDIFRHSFSASTTSSCTLVPPTPVGVGGLGPLCTRCPLLAVCGGGLFAHRYASGTGFRNLSVYCADLTALILHIRARVQADLVTAPPSLPELDVRH